MSHSGNVIKNDSFIAQKLLKYTCQDCAAFSEKSNCLKMFKSFIFIFKR